MASATSYATYAMAMAGPAGQCALLAPKAPSSPLLSLREPGVCLPSYAVSFSCSHTPLPTHRFARFITSAREDDGGTLESETERKGDSLHFPKANLIMMHSKLICCKISISESRNPSAIAKIDQAAWSKPDEVVVLSKFGDYFYNRVRYTLISYIPEKDSSNIYNPMKDVLMKMVDAAILMLDLKQHSGEHPRMGVIDDLSFHPLGDTEMKDAAGLAEQVAIYIAGKKVPVFLYGEAHKDKKELRKVRRELGYYNHVSPGIQVTMKPDFGPPFPLQPTDGDFLKSGAATVGVSPFLEGYNVPVRCENDADRTNVKGIVKELRKQLGGGGGGSEGLPKVLAIALRHGNGIEEVACLLDPNHVSAYEVQNKVKEIAKKKELGDKVEKGYYTDITKDMIPVTLAMN